MKTSHLPLLRPFIKSQKDTWAENRALSQSPLNHLSETTLLFCFPGRPCLSVWSVWGYSTGLNCRNRKCIYCFWLWELWYIVLWGYVVPWGLHTLCETKLIWPENKWTFLNNSWKFTDSFRVSDLFTADWIKGGRQGLQEAKPHLRLTHQEHSRTLEDLISSIGSAVWDHHTN